ncbi:MAG: hypothetical protein KKA42_11040, partial [candidate division Zixibacteria bacterium]|nr:hypothetical protein [candidate division Zixibacteria bacterium]
MKTKLILMLILLTMVASAVPAQVTAPRNIAHTRADHALLAIPRYKGGIQGDTLALMFAQAGTGDHGWVISTDKGQNYTAVAAQIGQASFDSWYLSDHSCAWFAGGFHIAYRISTTSDPMEYRYIGAPYGAANREAVDIVGAGTDTYFPIIVASGADDVWIFNLETNANGNLRYWHSTDRFESDVTIGRVYQASLNETTQNGLRIGAVLKEDGYPEVVAFQFGTTYTHSFMRFRYNGSSWDSTTMYADNSLGAGDRGYGHVSMNGRSHLVYHDNDNGYVYHVGETAGGSFTRTVVSQAVYAGNANPQLSVYGSGPTARLYAVWNCTDGGDLVVSKSFTEADGWDADSVRIMEPGYSPSSAQLMPLVPADYSYIPVYFYSTTRDSIYVVQLDASGGTSTDPVPPEQIDDLGAAPGDDEGSVRLTWT